MPKQGEGLSQPGHKDPALPQLFTMVGTSMPLPKSAFGTGRFIANKGIEKVLKDALRKKYTKDDTAAAFTGKIDPEDKILDAAAQSRSYFLEPEIIQGQLALHGYVPASTEQFLRHLMSVNKRPVLNARGEPRAYICIEPLDEYTKPVSPEEKTLVKALTTATGDDVALLTKDLEDLRQERMVPQHLVATWNGEKWYVVPMSLDQIRAYTLAFGRPVFVGVEKRKG